MAGCGFWKRQASLESSKMCGLRWSGLASEALVVVCFFSCDVIGATWIATGPVCPVPARQGGEAGEL